MVTVVGSPDWNWWSLIGLPVAFLLYWWVQAAYLYQSALPVPILILTLAAMAAQTLWTLGRSEVLCFDEDDLKIKQRILLYSRSREFDLSKISEPFFLPASNEDTERGQSRSALAFHYQGSHYRCLEGIDQREVVRIVTLLKRIHPELQRIWKDQPASVRTGDLGRLDLSST